MKPRQPIQLAGIALAIAITLSTQLHGQTTCYWDPNGFGTAGSGNAGGTWDTGVTANWNTDSTGGGTTNSTFADGDLAMFSAGTDGTGAWTVTVSGTVKPGGITFEEDGSKTLTDGSISVAANPTFSSAGRSNGNNFNFNSLITGTGNLILAANGSTSDSGDGVGGNLTLGNNSNDFTGNITIQSGVVNFSSNTAFGNPANTITLAGGGFVCTAATNNLPATRSLILAGGGDRIFRAYGSSTFTINGPISGAGNVRHTDGGTLVLNGANTFTGNINNVRGNLTLGNSAHTGNVTMTAGTLVLNAPNTYTGYTHISTGTTLRLDADNVLPNGTTTLFYGNTTFNANGKTNTFGSLTTGSSGDSSCTLNLGTGANLTITNNSLPAGMTSGYSNATFHGKITGTGNITYAHATQIAGSAQWDWGNTANDFTGTVTITQGRLRVLPGAAGADTILGNAANDIVFNGDIVATLGNQEGKASLQVTNGTNLVLGTDRDIILNAGKEGTFYVWGSTTTTVNGKVTGGGNLRKEDSGLLLLTNPANDWTGETKVILGELRLGAIGTLPPATSVTVANGGTLSLATFPATVTGLSGGGQANGVVSGSNTLTVNGPGTYDYSGRVTDGFGGGNNGLTVRYAGTGSLTLSGAADNSGGRAAVSSGTLILGKTSAAGVHAVGTNNITAVTVNGGTLQLGGTGGDQIYTEANVELTGGTFDLNERSEGFRGLVGTGGVITNQGTAASQLTVGQSSVAGDRYTFAGTIQNGVSSVDLVKTGSGTQVLSGTSTYTGITNVNGGVLQVDGALGATAVTVSAAATLAGNGSVGDQVTVKAGGGLGTTISDWNGAAGTGFTDLAIAAALTFEEGLHSITVNTTGMATFSYTDKVFPIATAAGGIAGFNAPDFTVNPVGFTGPGTWSVQIGGNTLAVVYTAPVGYDKWIAEAGITGPMAAFDADADHDGITNGIEFVLGGSPTVAGDVALPAASLSGSEPNRVLTVIYRRSDASQYLNPALESGDDLASWQPVVNGVNGATVVVDNDFYATGIDKVTVTLPANASAKFVRLAVTK